MAKNMFLEEPFCRIIYSLKYFCYIIFNLALQEAQQHSQVLSQNAVFFYYELVQLSATKI
jgi:hypothetical protein